MNDEAPNPVRDRLLEAAQKRSRSLTVEAVDELPAGLTHFYRLQEDGWECYFLLPGAPAPETVAWLEAAGFTEWRPPGEPGPSLLLEYILGRSSGAGVRERFSLYEEEEEDEAGGYLLCLPHAGEKKLTTDEPVDLLAGRALLDEALLETETRSSWLLVRCERIGFGSAAEVRKLLGKTTGSPGFHETGKRKLLSESALESLSEKGAGRLNKALPKLFTTEGGEERVSLLLLFRVTRGEATGTLRSSRLLFVAPLANGVEPGTHRFRELLFTLLSAQLANDKEAGASWLRLLAPRRYQYRRPSPGATFLYSNLVSLGRAGVQRVLAELRREAPAFRALGMMIATAPEFHASALREALSPGQRELLLPRRPPKREDYAGRLTALIEALRTIEGYAENNPATAAHPGMELFQRIARERYRRIRARVDASVSAGIFALLFEHARLSWLQRAWSRIPRREMVRALAFEPPRIIERAGGLYSRRGRMLLREDVEALSLRAEEWAPSQVTTILRARRRLWPILMDQLFDAESTERYVAALAEATEAGGFPAAVAALTLLRLEELRPGSAGPKLLIPAAARVAAEPRLDEESEPQIAAIADDSRLLRQGGTQFAWLLAHALERMGRPETAADVLELMLRRLAAKKGELPPEEQRRAKRLSQKYRELTS